MSSPKGGSTPPGNRASRTIPPHKYEKGRGEGGVGPSKELGAHHAHEAANQALPEGLDGIWSNEVGGQHLDELSGSFVSSSEGLHREGSKPVALFRAVVTVKPNFVFGPTISCRKVSSSSCLAKGWSGRVGNHDVDASPRINEQDVSRTLIFFCANEAVFFLEVHPPSTADNMKAVADSTVASVSANRRIWARDRMVSKTVLRIVARRAVWG
mmetsp:Transcript_17594/g.44756  ORF Transcript_17594/g.44756 Transcript_17594/m.44756 type:complete len:212 (-) Transcript_17594:385-1020(-)